MQISEKIEIASKLQDHHYLFRAFWDMSQIAWVNDKDIDVAAVHFDSEGNCICLSINEDFWHSISIDDQIFIICHECLHVVLEHAKRFIEYYGNQLFENMNKAADIVINHMLCEQFGFDRNKLTPRISEEGCFIDTVFKHNPNSIKKNESTEYYFNLLNISKDILINSNISTLDNHIVLSEEEAQEMNALLEDNGFYDFIDDDFIEKVSTNTKEYDKLKRQQAQSGSGGGGWTNIKPQIVNKKKKWESVIKKWEVKKKKSSVNIISRWDRISPRYCEILNSDKFKLPSDNWIIDEYMKEEQINVFFFLDTSGSCYHLKDRFFKAAKSLDPKKFIVHLFAFDTSVKALDISKPRIYGGGGTSFSIIETEIQKVIKAKKIKYPHAVWIITDGYGNNVSPQKPENWYWFLTNSHSKYNIPNKSKIFMLKDYE